MLLEHSTEGIDNKLGVPYSNTALIEASGRGKLNHVKLLLEYGADPNKQNKYGTTALIHVFSNFNEEKINLDCAEQVLISLLRAEKIDLNLKSCKLLTAIDCC